MVNCFPRKFDRTVSHFIGVQIKSVISVLTRPHETLLVPDRGIVVMTESAHTEAAIVIVRISADRPAFEGERRHPTLGNVPDPLLLADDEPLALGDMPVGLGGMLPLQVPHCRALSAA